jgi:phosphatidylserine/phosphatidylglycerophosphate/cardiolipin synthase-like enzyme
MMVNHPPVFAAWSWVTPEDDPIPALLDLLRVAKKSIRVAAYGFTLAPVIDELIDAHKRGLDVRLILDASQAGGPAERAQVRRLKKAGVPLVEGRSEKGGIIHLKMFIVDGQWRWAGSWNVSESADKQDNEVYLFYWPEAANTSHLLKFEKEWKRLTKKK